MCGIVGYIGGQNAAPILIEGLTRLEYRGYDSAGISVLGGKGAQVHRIVGRVRNLTAALPKRLAGKVGIGHTRWATHGPATEANAHPHVSEDGRISVVHNGIIDNADALREQLTQAGVTLSSETDTEVLAHLIARSGAKTLEDAVVEAVSRVTGTYAIAVTDTEHPDRVVVARNGSPLIIGVGDREMFVASDLSALVRHTSQVVHLDDGEFASVSATGYRTFTVDESDTGKAATAIDIQADDLDLGGHQHYMYKEIQEQPECLERMIRGRLDDRFGVSRLDGLNLTPRDLRGFARVKILGCGSAYYAGQIGATMIEDLARVPADAEAASEFRYRNPIIEADTLYIAVSQSGETADTAFAVEEVKRKGGRVVGLVNVVGSTIARACDGGLYLHAGPEIAVASTKALTNMAVGFAMIALALGRVRDLSNADGQRIVAALRALPKQVAAIVENEAQIAEQAKICADARSLFFIGRVRGFPVAREGAQKFKEISYRHAEAYQTSELKHGPLALIDEELPTVAIVPSDDLADRNLAAMQQIKARKGQVLAITHDDVDFGDLDVPKFVVPRSEPELDPILLTIPLQLLAYHAALLLGHDIDKPRNLAKSVTVE
ncbi:glutamine--fructose-6-phosphate transaminase (isomerizing) [Amycolatopsis keratiniphila]|uniref:Glutamine--fructose-6-phosphate aminotransferase [isomerizing] n=1 Tax=Amycolatopsis keratiniphila subsp. keratiniphila TaxID=227715 RepID=A0A1W2LW84_9PSEU|nr:glutamine--fructose-6-phosphate transaminase (isomerizing) [Amycolatopsis keratiniphila]OLZ57806.1 glutamine--fructose-6-phosphate aminotransferase [Amycolatopsis keratiniphila subsp. nogabecina]ONF70803.1 glutamine--fructose-6-phosphate aminotransferase [Amycolatopsis keratiniphila subsp. keratiniphila]SDU02841.1 glucosamine--fructose-6-phosphate aminotransferase (isomerizing) [Amycolatopsis keratiniphila]